jgi:hypothetical protein
MISPFSIRHLDVEKLLTEWRWLCPDKMALVARNAFGDLFLRDEAGRVFWLDVAAGKLSPLAASEEDFQQGVKAPQEIERWFAKSDERKTSAHGLNPSGDQCIGFATPLVFAESRSNNKPFVVDIYEHVSFLGDLHRQLSATPDGTKVRLNVAP